MAHKPYDSDTPTVPRPSGRPRKRKRRFPRPFRRICRGMKKWPPAKIILFRAACVVLIVGCLAAVIILRSANNTAKRIAEEAAPSPTPAASSTPTPTATVTPTPNPLDSVVIKNLGETNELLPAVQERLVELYYMDAPADGFTSQYSSPTKIGVLLFQIKNYEDSTQWDGQLGAGTYALLMSEQAKPYYLGLGDGDERTKIITKLVNDVKRLQDRLIELGYMTITRASGYYGSSTADAVRTFQKYHGLPSDGRAGQETLHLLYSENAMDVKTGKSGATPAPLSSASPAA